MFPQEKLDIRLISSLAKVFSDEELQDETHEHGTMLKNEIYSFQAAYRWNGSLKKHVRVEIKSSLTNCIKIYKVGLVPSEMPCYYDHDDNILRSTPGLYPDILLPIDCEGLSLLPEQWRSLWVEIVPENKVSPGVYPITISITSEDGILFGTAEFMMEIIAAELPEQELIYTNWFHTDCLATWYGVEVFCEEHWRRIEQYVQTAVSHGMNMILTPVFTPPLDTQFGCERPTVQLIDVEANGDKYKFGFSKLKRWFDLCKKNGIKYFEISHLFTQWGAKHAPKIICKTCNSEIRIFGWETDSAGEAYGKFLSQFLPELTHVIKQEGLESKCFFHVSDEPLLEHMESYAKASKVIYEHIKDFPVIDALSNYEFYENGLIKKPIPATDHIDEFLKHNVPGLWTYYCCGQYKEVSNRFFNMSSSRNRILGYQLYRSDIEGFLHWGYNFWYSQYSLHAIDPFRTTDADHAFPSGDAFVVYPGEDGPLISFRLKVFYEALQDLRALKLLEKLAGREEVIKILEEGLETPITFSQYPKEADWLLKKREQINQRISQHLR